MVERLLVRFVAQHETLFAGPKANARNPTMMMTSSLSISSKNGSSKVFSHALEEEEDVSQASLWFRRESLWIAAMAKHERCKLSLAQLNSATYLSKKKDHLQKLLKYKKKKKKKDTERMFTYLLELTTLGISEAHRTATE